MKKVTLIFLFFILTIAIVSCSCPADQPQPLPPPTPAPTPPPPAPAPEPQPTPPAAPPPSSQNVYAEQLAQKFSPIIYLKGEGDNPENYEPTQVDIFIEHTTVRDIQDPSFSVAATLSNLLKWSKSIYYMDIVELGPSTKSHMEYKQNYDQVRGNYQPTVYARVIENVSEGHTVVQYWLFYYLNDWRNIHEGDWELVQLHFPGNTAKDLVEAGNEPISVAYSQHQGGQRMSWDTMKETAMVADTHPLVYVAQGSHANYFAPGNYWSGLDFDDTGLSSWHVITPDQLNVSLLPEIGNEQDSNKWLDFKGYWGEYLGFKVSVLGLTFWQRGPFGPQWSEGENINERWANPYQWGTMLPEFPKPFWTGLIDIPGDWSKLAVFSIFSPADLHVYDAKGRHVGLDEQGNLEQQIPGAMYILPEGTDYKTILIPDADVTNEYRVVTRGKESGIMDIRALVPDIESNLRRFLEFLSVPVSPKAVARAIIKPTLPSLIRVPSTAELRGGTTRDIGTSLEIDSEGDGVFEAKSAPGQYIREEVAQQPEEKHTPRPLPQTDNSTSASVPIYTYQVVNSYEHDQNSFTQGLVFEDGILYEGTGRYGESALLKIDLDDNEVLQMHQLPAEYFGEGITIFGNNIIQLTWKENKGFVYDKINLELLREFSYPTEGWGITHDGERLIMSDGSSTLYFLDPEKFSFIDRIDVYDKEGPVSNLNELEYIDGQIFANIWQSDRIAIINPQTGQVTGWVDLKGLLPSEQLEKPIDVLNGIAFDAENNHLFVTGKLWPFLFEIKISRLD